MEIKHSIIDVKTISTYQYRQILKDSKDIFENSSDEYDDPEENSSVSEETANSSFNTNLLNDLAELSKKKKRVYGENLKQYGLYVYLLGGCILYENVSRNLQLPSISTIRKYLFSLDDYVFYEAILRGN